MRAYLPFILVLLALFTAACIIYIAWEVSSDKPGPSEEGVEEEEPDEQ